MEIKKVKVTDLKEGPIRHQALPAGFIQRVKDFKKVLEEVETSSIESTLENFQRDLDPESELVIWEHIASLYQWTTIANTGLSLEQKKEVMSVILGLSMGMKDFSNIKTLTKEVIDEITDRYPHI